jgi:hypothetical protein
MIVKLNAENAIGDADIWGSRAKALEAGEPVSEAGGIRPGK